MNRPHHLLHLHLHLLLLSLSLSLLLLPPAAAGGRRHHYPAHSPAALAYAATTGCTIITFYGACEPDTCFRAGGRCKVNPHGSPACYPHMQRGDAIVLRQWTAKDGVEECRGCRCKAAMEEGAPAERKRRERERERERDREKERTREEKGKGVLGREKWVWGVGGGVVGMAAGEGVDAAGRAEEACVVKSTAACDAAACWREGGRCKIPARGKRCRTHVRAMGVDLLLRGWTAKREHAGRVCRGCVCEAVSGRARANERKKGGEGEGAGDGSGGGSGGAGSGGHAGGGSGEDSGEFHRFLAELLLPTLDGGAVV